MNQVVVVSGLLHNPLQLPISFGTSAILLDFILIVSLQTIIIREGFPKKYGHFYWFWPLSGISIFLGTLSPCSSVDGRQKLSIRRT